MDGLCDVYVFHHGTGVWGLVRLCFLFFQAEDGIRDLVRSRGLGDVYKRQLFKVGAANPFHPFSNPLSASGSPLAAETACRCVLSLIHI